MRTQLVRWIRSPGTLWVLGLVLCLLSTYAQLMKPSRDRDQPWIWGWDNNHYFAWGRSLAIDGDWDFANDFGFVAGLRGGGSTQVDFAAYLNTCPRTPIGRVPNKYGVGFGLLAVPAIVLARGAAVVWEIATGTRVSAFAAVYVLAFVWTSVLVSFAGLAVLFRILREEHGEKIALCAVFSGMLGLSTGYYVFFDPTMAHAAVFGVSAFYLAAVLRWDRELTVTIAGEAASARKSAAMALLAGLALGVCCTIRYTGVVLAALPVVIAIGRVRSCRGKDLAWFVRLIGCGAVLFLVGAVIGFLPQAIAWKRVYGSWLLDTYAGETSYHWPRHGLHVLFGTRAGLFVWTPLALAAVAGLFVGLRNHKRLALPGIATLLATLWIYGCWGDYGLGHSYGMRGFVDVSIFLFAGLSVFFAWLSAWRNLAVRRGVSGSAGRAR